jgi:hypothetical protein
MSATVARLCLMPWWGIQDFYQSALAAVQQILPESPTYRLRLDHPIFPSYYEIKKVKYRERVIRDGVVTYSYPWIDGVDIDNRTAILISRFDLSMGWEKNHYESWGYEDSDAKKLGGNLISYVTAMPSARTSASF